MRDANIFDIIWLVSSGKKYIVIMKTTQKCTKEYVDNVNNMAVGCTN
jgi:hypothetical protein